MTTCRPGTLSATALLLCAVAVPTMAHADTDACSVLTPAQVGAAAGVAVSTGKHVTPTFVKTCTWSATGNSDVKFINALLADDRGL